MEPRGCNRWQSAASHAVARTAEIGKTVATGCHPFPEKFHVREGVDGSSPSEGSAKAPHDATFCFVRSFYRGKVMLGWSRFWSILIIWGA
jgi:hypothetical protein